MIWDYGFGDIGNRLIEACKETKPDFAMIEALISQMDTLTLSDKYEDENILSRIILCYPDKSYYVDFENLNCDEDAAQYAILDGRNLPKIIELFLKRGFDVRADSGSFGASCLANLAYTVYDRFILDSAKILLDAGADPVYKDSDDDNAISIMAMKESSLRCCHNDHENENLFYTMAEILDAASKGKPYQGIDYYPKCIGLPISSINIFRNRLLFTSNPDGSTVMASDIVFNCEGELLVLTTNLNLFINPYVSDSTEEGKEIANDLFGVSIIDHTITSIYFEHNEVLKDNTHYGQPVIVLCLDDCTELRFTHNFGEVPDSERESRFIVIVNR